MEKERKKQKWPVSIKKKRNTLWSLLLKAIQTHFDLSMLHTLYQDNTQVMATWKTNIHRFWVITQAPDSFTSKK